MEKYYKKPVKVDGDVRLKIVDWHATDQATDTDDGSSDEESSSKQYVIRVFGVTDSGVSVTVQVDGFNPFYYVKVPSTFTENSTRLLLGYMRESYALKNDKEALVVSACKLVFSKDIYGFSNETMFKFVKLVFTNYSTMMKSRYAFKNPVGLPGIAKYKYTLYESNIEPFIRYSHIQDVLMAGWVKVKAGSYTQLPSSKTRINLRVYHKDLLPDTKVSKGNFLQASWDIEVYSVDGSFPSPLVPGNVIFQIATTYKYNDSDATVTQLLTLKKCSKVTDPDVVVEECSDERDLVKRWVDTIHSMDPDIMYTYNGDSFDCNYIWVRARQLGLEEYFLAGVSRLSGVPCVFRKEAFSSAAYGDSDVNRLYIPGRLNYDLMIHFKRGQIKYPKYSLDYIASTLLGETKCDVSVSEIFSFYREGIPDRIREVGMYCVQDTRLLQKLVDTQKILESITQMSNVTYTPISFLLTKGQVAKVHSQILRKARQMGFLVPHTNFCSNDYPVRVVPHKPIYLKPGASVELKVGWKASSGVVTETLPDGSTLLMVNTPIDASSSTSYKLDGRPLKSAVNVETPEPESFTGGAVLEPESGLYLDNVGVLDFKSLYPSIMMAYNLCYSTFVMGGEYANIPGVPYETVEWEDTIRTKMVETCDGLYGAGTKKAGERCGRQAYFTEFGKHYCKIHDPLKKTRDTSELLQVSTQTYKYTVVKPDGEKYRGVIPSLLYELSETRTSVKKQMSKAYADGDMELVTILNSQQLAIKLSMNSTYGYLGRGRGNMVLKELGSIVTSIGRMLIHQSKDYTEQEFVKSVEERGQLFHQIRVT